VEPGIYIETLFPLLMSAVNAIMDATPVENLPGVQAGSLTTGPPDDASFSAARRRRIRLFSGVA
jgi:hypothetical protein